MSLLCALGVLHAFLMQPMSVACTRPGDPLQGTSGLMVLTIIAANLLMYSFGNVWCLTSDVLQADGG